METSWNDPKWVAQRIGEITAEHRTTTEPRNKTALKLRLKKFEKQLKNLLSPEPLAS